MAKRRKNVQVHPSGCKICGDKRVGRGIAKHLEGAHGLEFQAYKKCFGSGKVILDSLTQTGTAANGTKKVMIHVLVRRFLVPI